MTYDSDDIVVCYTSFLYMDHASCTDNPGRLDIKMDMASGIGIWMSKLSFNAPRRKIDVFCSSGLCPWCPSAEGRDMACWRTVAVPGLLRRFSPYSLVISAPGNELGRFCLQADSIARKKESWLSQERRPCGMPMYIHSFHSLRIHTSCFSVPCSCIRL